MKKKLLGVVLVFTSILALAGCKFQKKVVVADDGTSEVVTVVDMGPGYEAPEIDPEEEASLPEGFKPYIDTSNPKSIFATYDWLVGDTILTRENTIEDLVDALTDYYGDDVIYTNSGGYFNDDERDEANPLFQHKIIVGSGETSYYDEYRELGGISEMTFNEFGGVGFYYYCKPKDGAEAYLETGMGSDEDQLTDIRICVSKEDTPTSSQEYNIFENRMVCSGVWSAYITFEKNTHKLVAIDGYPTDTDGETRYQSDLVRGYRLVEDGPMLYDKYTIFLSSPFNFDIPGLPAITEITPDTPKEENPFEQF